MIVREGLFESACRDKKQTLFQCGWLNSAAPEAVRTRGVATSEKEGRTVPSGFEEAGGRISFKERRFLLLDCMNAWMVVRFASTPNFWEAWWIIRSFAASGWIVLPREAHTYFRKLRQTFSFAHDLFIYISFCDFRQKNHRYLSNNLHHDSASLLKTLNRSKLAEIIEDIF